MLPSNSPDSQTPPTGSLGLARLWNRLGVRLTAVIVPMTLVTIAILLVLVLRVQERYLVGLVVDATNRLTDTIRSSTHYDMLEDRRNDVYRILDAISRQPGIEHVRIFNEEGRVAFSTNRAEIDTYADRRAESCYPCHADGQSIANPGFASRTRVVRREGHRVLAMMMPIYNEPSCSSSSCHVHRADQRVLGVIDLSVSLAPVDEGLTRLRSTTVLIGTLAVVAFGVVIALFAHVQVFRPVDQLVKATRRVAKGDLAHPIAITGQAELGELQRSFNDMAQALAQARAARLQLLESLEQQVRDRTSELQRARERLVQSQKLSSLGHLAASIAHEINNPLAGILTYAKLLIRTLERAGQDDGEAKRDAVKDLRLVQRETERCAAIVRQLLEFAKERPLARTDLMINQIIEEALVLVASQARLANIESVKDYQDIPPVNADAGQMRQVIINLIINACEAMPQGGRLDIGTRLGDDGFVEIRIADSGQGIAREHLSKVLEPFFTTKEKGTGLGLSVVYGIVEQHGGTFAIESEVGVGTVTTIRLPASHGRAPRAVDAAGAPATA